MNCLFCGLMTLFGAVMMTACYQAEPPKRPEAVPASAVWSGGPDGGSWIHCRVDAERKANYCTIYHATLGSVEAEGWYVRRDTKAPAQQHELVYKGFDGLRIHLANGAALEGIELKRGLSK